jgi:beta-mannosidase
MLLNGNWNYLKDEFNEYSFEEAKEKLNSSQNDIKVPKNWQLTGIDNFSGSIWYLKTFRIEDDKLPNTVNILKFNGIDYFADVWLNGSFIGHHEGYFQPFHFNVTDQLNFKKSNQLIVKVNSPKEEPDKIWPLKKQLIKGIFNHHDCRPGSWSMEFGQDQNTGGIWNDVELFINEKIFISNAKITSSLDDEYKTARIQINIEYLSQLQSPLATSLILEVQAPDKSIQTFRKDITISSGQSEIIVFFKIMRPKLWWSWDLGKQNIYNVKLTFEKLKVYKEEFAIRKVELDKNGKFFLNGKELFLRGTNIIPTQFLSELNTERIEKIVGLIKAANVNAVRVHAHVNRRELYSKFDKKGIIVWQDFSLQWTYEESEVFTENAVRQIKEMVNVLYNHPSICFWCCHNEPGNQVNTLDPLLKDAVLSQDQSRIIRLASNYEEHPYDGWYWGNKEHFAAAPMGPIVTEFGAQGLPDVKSLKKFIPEENLFPPDLEKWKYHNFQPDTTFNIAKISLGRNVIEFVENSQNYQSELLKTAIHFYRRKKNNGITGIFQFMFIDCWPSITWSVVDYYLVKKKAYNTLKECFSPVLLSVFLRQDQYFVESKLNFDFHIINDTHKKLNKLELNISINKKSIAHFNNLNLEGNSLLFKHFESLKVMLPKSLNVGLHDLEFDLIDNGRILSSNKFSITVINYPGN